MCVVMSVVLPFARKKRWKKITNDGAPDTFEFVDTAKVKTLARSHALRCGILPTM